MIMLVSSVVEYDNSPDRDGVLNNCGQVEVVCEKAAGYKCFYMDHKERLYLCVVLIRHHAALDI